MRFGISKPTPRAVVPDRRGEPASAQEGWYSRKKPSWARQFVSNCRASALQWAKAAIDAVMNEMHRIDRTMSPHKSDSELSRINRRAATEPVP